VEQRRRHRRPPRPERQHRRQPQLLRTGCLEFPPRRLRFGV
jgi:hypothetical protein